MFLNLLAAAFDPSLKDKKIPVGEAAIDAVVGLAVVFIGIALLVFIVWGVGQIMQKTAPGSKKQSAPKAAETKKEPKKAAQVPVAVAKPAEQENEPDEETIAVITAAIAAVYEAEKRSCGFVVKRIKRM